MGRDVPLNLSPPNHKSMSMSNTINELAAALIAAQAELPKLHKDKANPFYKSNYAGLETVMPAALGVLTKHELGIIQTVGQDGNGGSTLTSTLIHKSGEWVSDTQRLLLTKDDPQGQGSAITYARRYALMAMIGLVAEDDDDGNAAVPKPAPRPAAESRRETPRPANKVVGIQPGQIKAIRASLTDLFGEDEQAAFEWMQRTQPKAAQGTEIHIGGLTDREASDIIAAMNKERRERQQG